jgi:hypothetical protein
MNSDKVFAALNSVRGFEALKRTLGGDEIEEAIAIESSTLRRKTMLDRLYRALRVSANKNAKRKIASFRL